LDYSEDLKYRLHSDFNFCLKAKNAGIEIWASSRKRIGHMTLVEKFAPKQMFGHDEEEIL